jgi:hypothetical protein
VIVPVESTSRYLVPDDGSSVEFGSVRVYEAVSDAGASNFTMLVPSLAIGPLGLSSQCVEIHPSFVAFRIFIVELLVVVSSQDCHASGELGAVDPCECPRRRSNASFNFETEAARVSEEITGAYTIRSSPP